MFFMYSKSRSLISVLIACVAGGLIFRYFVGSAWLFGSTDLASKGIPEQHPVVPAPHAGEPDCARFSAAADMLVVVKTGATEIHQKLPIHLSTTLRCIPHFVIYSDMAEEFQGHPVYDVLDAVSPGTKMNNDDFSLYRELQEYHSAGRNISELIDGNHQKAWNLDKWKFIPMMDKALQARPSAKWFYFIETDTAVVWDNLFAYVSRFQPDKSWYIGGQSWLGDVEFAHGGTGFVMSSQAVRLVAEKWTKEQTELEKLVTEHYAGDMILAKVLKTMDIGLTKSWPIFQGETPDTLDYSAHHWCYPVASYHHVNNKWIQAISDFQEEWVLSVKGKDALRHRDAFEKFVQPNLQSERQRWDNISKDEKSVVPSTADACRESCKNDPECVQWFFAPGKCKTGNVVRLGSSTEEDQYSVEMVSGWMLDRVDAFTKQQGACDDKDYWVP